MSDVELDALALSLSVACVATLACVAPAALLAYWLARTRRRWLRIVVESVVVLPLVLPPVVVGYLLLIAFGRNGPVGRLLEAAFGLRLAFTWEGAALAAGLLGMPLMVRAMRQAFEAVDPGLEAAAHALGAGRLRTALTVTLPLALRGVIAGAALCFARCIGEFGATITFAGNIQGETQTLPLALWTALQGADAAAEERAWRLTWICIGLSLVATVSSELLLARRREEARTR